MFLILLFPGFAMERYAYYVCFKCGKAYFGGEARCDIEAGGGDSFNPEELVCGGCSDVSQVSHRQLSLHSPVWIPFTVQLYSACVQYFQGPHIALCLVLILSCTALPRSSVQI